MNTIVYLVFGIGLAIISIVFVFTRKNQNFSAFNVADRKVGVFTGALSIAATWTWAPAVLVSARQSYQQGFVGAFWFIAPNILTLIIFSFFAKKLRDNAPNGYTLPSYMLGIHGRPVQNVYKSLMALLNPMCIAIQLIAGGRIVSFILGIPYVWCVLAITIIVLLYTIIGGLKGTILSDVVQIILVLGVIIIIVPIALSKFYQLGGNIFDGIGGQSGVYYNLFNRDGLYILLTYGITQSIGLLAGPWGDQIYWHRVYALRKEKVRTAFILGALIFAIIPISMAMLGFVGASGEINGFWSIGDVSIVNFETLTYLLPLWATGFFAIILLCVIAGTMSSAMSSFATLINVDFLNFGISNLENDKKSLLVSRLSMVSVSAIAFAIAIIPRIDLLYFFLFYTVLRSSTLFATYYTIKTRKRNTKTIFIAILSALAIGAPIHGYGSVKGNFLFTLIGSIATVSIPLIVIVFYNKFFKIKQKEN